MRAGIRKQILENVAALKDCYEPNVPKYDTPKPYGVVVQGEDSSRQDPTSFHRSIEVWIYANIGTFKNLDLLAEETIKSLNLKTFTDPNTNLSYTTSFTGTIGKDIVDEEWKAIIRGLSFSVIALHSSPGGDSWEKAFADFIEKTINVKSYSGTWCEGFKVPSVLCRTLSKTIEPINAAACRETRDMRIHVVGYGDKEINEAADSIELELMKAIKIPLNIEERRYLTIKSIKENRDNDMLGVGQITVSATRINNIETPSPYIEKIYSRGQIE